MSGNFCDLAIPAFSFGVVGDTGIRDCEWRSTEQDNQRLVFFFPSGGRRFTWFSSFPAGFTDFGSSSLRLLQSLLQLLVYRF